MINQIKEKAQYPVLLNNAVHEFQTIEKRIFYIVINQIKKGFGVDQEIFNSSIWFDVPTNLIGTQSVDKIRETIEGITSRKIRIFNREGDEVHYFVPFPEVKYQKRWGHVKVRILDTAYPYLAELKEGYFWYRLKSALLLSRAYSQRFYEWFCQYIDTGRWINVSVEFIRTRLDIPDDEYLRNNDFVRRIVHDSLKEINEKTDIHVEILRYHKKGRKIEGFDFSIRTKKNEEEAGKYKKIEEYYEHINKLDRKELSQFLLRIKDEYEINNDWYSKLFTHKALLEEVLKVDSLIQANKVEIATTKAQYMNGVIKKKMSELLLN